MGVSVRYCFREAEAQDVFQESFVKIFLNIHKVKDVVALPAWVKKVTVTTAINHFHKHKRHRDTEDLDEAKEAGNDDYGLILQQMDNRMLVEIINTLPPGYKMVFNLYVVEGFTHPEIAEIMGISENTSKSQLSRAKELLRKHLNQRGIKSLTNYA